MHTASSQDSQWYMRFDVPSARDAMDIEFMGIKNLRLTSGKIIRILIIEDGD